MGCLCLCVGGMDAGVIAACRKFRELEPSVFATYVCAATCAFGGRKIEAQREHNKYPETPREAHSLHDQGPLEFSHGPDGLQHQAPRGVCSSQGRLPRSQRQHPGIRIRPVRSLDAVEAGRIGRAWRPAPRRSTAGGRPPGIRQPQGNGVEREEHPQREPASAYAQTGGPALRLTTPSGIRK